MSIRLPRTALAQCERIGECQAWANKAEALASYAKQAKDESLRQMADRIQARAMRRAGELLQQIDRKAGRPSKNSKGALTISKAAEDAGLSLHQKRTALRVASLPSQEFEAAVESDDPPTLTELAERGKQPPASLSLAHLWGRDPKEFNLSIHVQGELRRLAGLTGEYPPDAAVRGAFENERPVMLDQARHIRAWLDELIQALEKDQP